MPQQDAVSGLPWPSSAPPGVAPSVPPVAVVENVPWYKSTSYWGIIISVVLKLVFVVFKWNPGLSEEDTANLIRTLVIVASFVGDAMAARGRNNAVSGGVARSVYFTSPKK